VAGAEAAPDVATLVGEILKDAAGIFWGQRTEPRGAPGVGMDAALRADFASPLLADPAIG